MGVEIESQRHSELAARLLQALDSFLPEEIGRNHLQVVFPGELGKLGSQGESQSFVQCRQVGIVGEGGLRGEYGDDPLTGIEDRWGGRLWCRGSASRFDPRTPKKRHQQRDRRDRCQDRHGRSPPQLASRPLAGPWARRKLA